MYFRVIVPHQPRTSNLLLHLFRCINTGLYGMKKPLEEIQFQNRNGYWLLGGGLMQ